jgi:hypothetical protein
MELITVILMFVGAYALFMIVAYTLARYFFPTIEVKDEELPKPIIKKRVIQQEFSEVNS